MRHISICTASALILMTIAGPAEAYIGPGLGLGTIGAVFGVLFAVVLALFGLLWFPVKRLIARLKGDSAQRKVSGDAHINR